MTAVQAGVSVAFSLLNSLAAFFPCGNMTTFTQPSSLARNVLYRLSHRRGRRCGAWSRAASPSQLACRRDEQLSTISEGDGHSVCIFDKPPLTYVVARGTWDAPMSKSDEYRAKSLECERMARMSHNASEKAAWARMAEQWASMILKAKPAGPEQSDARRARPRHEPAKPERSQ